MEKRFKLKVEDVLNKQFNIDFKGYSSVEVDEFLDLAASLGNALVEKEQLFEYVWMEKGTKEALHFEVNGREAFYQALECIPGICQGISDNVLVPEHGGVRITMDGRIQRYFPEGEGRL